MPTNRRNYQRCACSSATKPAANHLQTLLDCRQCCKLNENTVLPESHLRCYEDPDCTINAIRLSRLNQRKKSPTNSPPSKKYHYLMVDKSTNVPKITINKKTTELRRDASSTTIINVKSHNAERRSRISKFSNKDLQAEDDDDDSTSMGSIDTVTTYLLAPRPDPRSRRRSENRSKMSSKLAAAVKNGKAIVWQENLSQRSTQIGAKQSVASTSSDFLLVLREVIKMDNRLVEKEPEPGPSAAQFGKIHRWFSRFKSFWRKQTSRESGLYRVKSPKDVSLYDYDDDDF